MAIPRIEGFGHIDLTVSDGERSVRWWMDVLGFRLLLDRHERPGFSVWNLYHPSGLAVGLMEHENPGGDRFDERAVGLDHVAFNVADRATLEAWAKRRGATRTGRGWSPGRTTPGAAAIGGGVAPARRRRRWSPTRV